MLNVMQLRYERRPRRIAEMPLKTYLEQAWTSLQDVPRHEESDGVTILDEGFYCFVEGTPVEKVENEIAEAYAPWGGLAGLKAAKSVYCGPLDRNGSFHYQGAYFVGLRSLDSIELRETHIYISDCEDAPVEAYDCREFLAFMGGYERPQDLFFCLDDKRIYIACVGRLALWTKIEDYDALAATHPWKDICWPVEPVAAAA